MEVFFSMDDQNLPLDTWGANRASLAYTTSPEQSERMHCLIIDSQGGGAAFSVLSPYFVLAYSMKV